MNLGLIAALWRVADRCLEIAQARSHLNDVLAEI